MSERGHSEPQLQVCVMKVKHAFVLTLATNSSSPSSLPSSSQHSGHCERASHRSAAALIPSRSPSTRSSSSERIDQSHPRSSCGPSARAQSAAAASLPKGVAPTARRSSSASLQRQAAPRPASCTSRAPAARWPAPPRSRRSCLSCSDGASRRTDTGYRAADPRRIAKGKGQGKGKPTKGKSYTGKHW